MHHIVLCCKSSWYVVPFSATHTSAVFILKMLRMSVLFRIALCYHLPSPSPPPRGVVVTYSTTDDFKTSFLHFSHFSTALWDLANSRTVSFLYCIVLYCIVLGYITLTTAVIILGESRTYVSFRIALCCIVSYSTVLYYTYVGCVHSKGVEDVCIVSYCSVLYCLVLYRIVSYGMILHSRRLCSC